MNDLPWIKYRPREMYLDTLGMSKEGKIAHRQLFDYILINDGPPPNDNDTLRELTSCSPLDWARVKRELIGKGWLETSKHFLHRGTIKTLNESKVVFVENHNQTAAANKKSRFEMLPPDPETGCVTYRVTPGVTSPVTPTQEQVQKQEQDYSLSSKLSEGGLGGVVARILGNGDGWAYDNCKVKLKEITAAQLTTVFRTFLERIEGARNLSGAQAVKAWLAAVLKAHKDATDGMITKNPEASCIDEFKRQLAAMAEKSKA